MKTYCVGLYNELVDRWSLVYLLQLWDKYWHLHLKHKCMLCVMFDPNYAFLLFSTNKIRLCRWSSLCWCLPVLNMASPVFSLQKSCQFQLWTDSAVFHIKHDPPYELKILYSSSFNPSEELMLRNPSVQNMWFKKQNLHLNRCAAWKITEKCVFFCCNKGLTYSRVVFGFIHVIHCIRYSW